MAEDTIGRLWPRKGRLPEWGSELQAVGDARREVGMVAVELNEVANELTGEINKASERVREMEQELAGRNCDYFNQA